MGNKAWDALNRKFYAANPVGYFARRFDLLMLVGGRSADLDALLAQGTTFHGYQHRRDCAANLSESEEMEYLIAEAQSLYHHASEALIRLFLAHCEMPVCPWIEVAALRQFPIFKARVAELKEPGWPPGMEAAVIPVFLGSEAADGSSDGYKRAIVRLIQILAAQLLDDANLYNAVKHGMAVRPGRSSLAFGDADGSNARALLDGPSIVYLESEANNSGRTWHETTRWIDFRRTIYVTDLATPMQAHQLVERAAAGESMTSVARGLGISRQIA